MHATKLKQFKRHLLAGAILAAFAASASAEIINLGTLEGGSRSEAYGVSANGSVVVGYGDQKRCEECFGIDQAFIWRQSGGMSSLGGLVFDGDSYAQGISADGRTVVGYAADSGGIYRAVRWRNGAGIETLGDLNGGSESRAFGISADGKVIVGEAENGDAGGQRQAFRWTAGSRMVSLVTPGGWSSSSKANAANADGSVIVGEAEDIDSGFQRAFRWTQAGGMVNLGTLGLNTRSRASGVSGDGSIVVGSILNEIYSAAFRWTEAGGLVALVGPSVPVGPRVPRAGVGTSFSGANGISTDGRVIVGWVSSLATGGNRRAFRWTETDGMLTVEQWLRNHGVTVASDMTQSANATNSDGSVVVGVLENEHAFLARISGLIDIAEFNTSLYSTTRLPMVVLRSSDLVLNGAHGNPMLGLLPEGRSSVWTAGDWGRSDHNERNDEMAVGEVGWSRGLAHGWQVKLAVGKTYDVSRFSTGGEGRIAGTYILPEAIWNVSGNLHATFSAYYNHGEADVRRGYLNAGTQDYSSGNADVDVMGGRVRLDWLNAFAIGGTSLTPYTSLTSLHTTIDGYTESGGGFPAQWNKRSSENNILRAGMDASYPLASSGITLLGRLEGAWRAEENGPRSTGQILGLNSFDFASPSEKRAWLRGSVGFEGNYAGGNFSLILNGATQGGSPDYWVAAAYRVNF